MQIRGKTRKSVVIEVYDCPVCGAKMFVPGNPGKLRPKNHPKNLYCVNCREETIFIKVSDGCGQ